jgi:hypothetical protein
MDACQFFLLRYEPVHRAVTERLLGELTDVQIRSRPIDGVNTIAWIVWHMARGEDLGVSRFVGHRPQLFFEEAWGERLNVPDADLGTGMTAEEVAQLSARIDLDGLRAYWAGLEHRTRAIVSGLHPEDLDAVNDPAYIREVVETDRMFREAGRWGEGYWAELPDRSKGYFLGYLGLTHAWLHYSEAMVTRSLLGLPGR